MIAAWLSLSLVARCVAIYVLAVPFAALANWAIYTVAYFPRPISPWTSPHPEAPQRLTFDRVPILGWLGLRREHLLHGRGFWVRPLLIELLFPLATVAYYLFVCEWWGLLDQTLVAGVRLNESATLAMNEWMHYLFVCHALLATLMIAATFIDFDEQTVPDWITVPGTILALGLSLRGYQLFPPFPYFGPDGVSIEATLLNAPAPWNVRWSGSDGLWLGLALISLWCFALADRRWIMRRGIGKAIQYFLAGLTRHSSWKLLVLIWIVGLAMVGGGYAWGGSHWQGMLTSLVGMAVGGAAVWSVRLVAGVAMRQEAMGFGDVTLMAMIGAFVGWQASLLAFVLAPMTAILIVLVQYALTKNRVTAFGPYLCAGTVVTMLFWSALWDRFGMAAFGMGAILPGILISLLCIMGVMLAVWRFIKESFVS